MIQLDDLEIYKSSMKIAEEIHLIIIEWDKFSLRTIGYQLQRLVDSIAANIAEGFG